MYCWSGRGRLWEPGSAGICSFIALDGGVWVSTNILHEGCAGHAMCYLGTMQERTCFVTFIRTFSLPVINAWFFHSPQRRSLQK